MNVSLEQKRAEAASRIEMLGILPRTMVYLRPGQRLRQDGRVIISEPPFGAFYFSQDEDLKRIHEFEESNNALVYLVIRSHTTIGKIDNYLFVSDHRDQWDRERRDLEAGEPLCYVYNHDMPDCSEFGCIGIEKTFAGGLLRTW